MSALWGLLRKETLHILRDRRTLVVLLLLPVLQVVIFGYAIRTDVEDVRLAVVDPSPDYATLRLRARLTAAHVFRVVAVLQVVIFGYAIRTDVEDVRLAVVDPTPDFATLRLRARLTAAHVFRVVAVLPDTAPLERLFQTGEAQAALVFEPGFADQLGRGLQAQLLVITDTTEPNTGVTIQNHVLSVVRSVQREEPARAGGVRIVPQARLRFNPTAESKNLFVPGLMAFVLTIISCLMTAITLTREKETGTMEALLVSPLRPWQIIVGKVAPYLLVGFASVVGVIAEARLVFDVPLRGSVTLLLAEGTLFILVSLALGVLISARTSSQRVAMTAALLGTMLPTMILSGFLFPVESMPRVLQYISNVVPAKWFVTIARGIMLKGVGLPYLWPETLVLLAMALVLLSVAARSFHERLE